MKDGHERRHGGLGNYWQSQPRTTKVVIATASIAVLLVLIVAAAGLTG